jgi:cytochrome c-type biogenesis protein CcmH
MHASPQPTRHAAHEPPRPVSLPSLGRLRMLAAPLAAALLTLTPSPAGAPAALAAGAARATPTTAAARTSTTVPRATPAVAPRATQTVAPRTTLPTVEGQVMCVTCKIPLSVADSPQANRERAFIQGLIDEGHTDGQVKRALVFQYGPAVLDLPASHGFDLTVYVVPLVVLLALLATIAVILPRWRRRARAAQAARAAEEIPSPGALSTADAARLEADMARFD